MNGSVWIVWKGPVGPLGATGIVGVFAHRVDARYTRDSLEKVARAAGIDPRPKFGVTRHEVLDEEIQVGPA